MATGPHSQRIPRAVGPLPRHPGVHRLGRRNPRQAGGAADEVPRVVEASDPVACGAAPVGVFQALEVITPEVDPQRSFEPSHCPSGRG